MPVREWSGRSEALGSAGYRGDVRFYSGSFMNGQKKASNTPNTPAPGRRFSKPSEVHIKIYSGLIVPE